MGLRYLPQGMLRISPPSGNCGCAPLRCPVGKPGRLFLAGQMGGDRVMFVQ